MRREWPSADTRFQITQLNAHDQDDDHVASPIDRSRHRLSQSTPASPPPSFHSRASSTAPRNRRVEDPALADAFDADDSDSDDEPDDRQRLVRQNSDLAPPSNTDSSSRQYTPLTSSSGASTPASRPPPTQPPRTTSAAAATSSNIIFGSGIQNDGIFSNLTAKPERSGTEKEEQPPVRSPAVSIVSVSHYSPCGLSGVVFNLANIFVSNRRTSKLPRMRHRRTGRRRFLRPVWEDPTKYTSTACPSAPSLALCGML